MEEVAQTPHGLTRNGVLPKEHCHLDSVEAMTGERLGIHKKPLHILLRARECRYYDGAELGASSRDRAKDSREGICPLEEVS